MSYLNLLLPVTGILILGFLLARTGPAHAQIARGGARAVALGEAATALDGSPWTTYNPALTAGTTRNYIELSVGQSFGLAALRNTALALVVPTTRNVFSATVRTFGFSQFRNTQAGLGMARRFSGSALPRGAVGLLLLYDHTFVAGHRSDGMVGAVAGGAVQLSSSVLLGLQAANIHRSIYRSSSTLPQQLAVGIAYRPDKRVQLLIDLQKDVRYPLALRTGVEFRPISFLTLRTGIATLPRLISAGIGLSSGGVSGAVAFVRHYALGWSPAVSLGTYW